MRLVGSSRAVRSPEFHKKKIRERWLRTAGFIAAACLIIGGPVLALRSEKLRISAVEVSGNSVTSAEEIRGIAGAVLAGYELKVLPKSSALLAPKSRIKEELLASEPRLSSVEVRLKGLHTLAVSVAERAPFALYCSDAAEVEPAQCYFLDQTGYAFAEAPDFSGGVYMIYGSEPALETPLRSQYLPADEFARVAAFVEAVRQDGLSPRALISGAEGGRILLANGTEIRFDPQSDLVALADDFAAFLGQSGLGPADISRLRYLDLRFENKVFYRYRDE